MGVRQSKRVDISSTPKKGEAENGAVAGAEEKLEKIEEGETAASKSNSNGVTSSVEQQEAAATNTESPAATETTPPKEAEAAEPESKTEVTEEPAVQNSTSEEVSSPVTPVTDENKQEVSSPASPSEATTEEGASEKKKKPKKKRFSFRKFSFSKRDKVKPDSKEEQKQQDTVPEGNETTSQAEQKEDEAKTENTETKEEKKDEQVPPPLPTSPPPTPAEEVPVVSASIPAVAAVVAAAAVTTAADPEKEETSTISEADVEASGGGEGLAEPLDDGEEESTEKGWQKQHVTNGTVHTTLLNGDAEMNGKITENGDASSPVCEILKDPVDSVTAKIDSLKMQIASENTDSPTQNGFGDHSLNGDMNGTDANGTLDCNPSSEIVSCDVSSSGNADD